MADIDALVAALTLDEKTSLLAGADSWSTVAVDRLGIPSIRVTDGPNGARGVTFSSDDVPPSICIPCGSAIGATWDPGLAEALGALLGRDALDRGCRALLAPTVNLHRSPLAGRNFECYSEDPFLSGMLAAGFVRGVQSRGVVATVKHFVANDQESERSMVSAVVDERALRELYLVPFELAIRDGGALGVMTSYNRLNGRWLTQQPAMLLDLLRGEWGFRGLVMTDWYAVAETVDAATAGLDLEMPGPGRAFGKALADAVVGGDVDEAHANEAVRRQLAAWDAVAALDAPTPMGTPEPPTVDEVELVRRASVESIVLLTNDGVLPLDVPTLRRVAVIGPNADQPRIMGGGSSQVKPWELRTPLEALRDALGPAVEVVHERGCEIDKSSHVVGTLELPSADGFVAEYFTGLDLEGEPVATRRVDRLRILALDLPSTDLVPNQWSMRVRGRIVAGESGLYRLTLAQSGRARLFVDGALVVDGFTDPPPAGGTDVFGLISQDAVADVNLEAGVPVDVLVEYATIEATLPAVRVGFHFARSDDLVERAAAVAADADVAIVVVGTSDEWESEGRDRTSFALPGRQDELVRRVAAQNPRTIVVVNAGAAVDLPWTDDVAAVLQCWFGGEGMAAAIAGVLTGADEPGGRLPMSIPMRIEHSPSYDNFPGENGEVRYGEGVYMGYRGHEHRCIPPRFAFGHGLGYTTFELGTPAMSATTFRPGGSLTVSVPVTNTGDRRGSEVVQCYVSPEEPRLARPPKELKAFAKVTLGPGESTVVDLVLHDRSFAYWDPGQPDWEDVKANVENATFVTPDRPAERRQRGWQIDPGRYHLHIGRSSGDLPIATAVDVVTP